VRGVEIWLHVLTSALDGGAWSASLPGHLTLRERYRGTNWLGGWMGPIVGLGAVEKGKIPASAGNETHLPCRPTLSLVIILTELPWLTVEGLTLLM
jgi:hypothetical protein